MSYYNHKFLPVRLRTLAISLIAKLTASGINFPSESRTVHNPARWVKIQDSIIIKFESWVKVGLGVVLVAVGSVAVGSVSAAVTLVSVLSAEEGGTGTGSAAVTSCSQSVYNLSAYIHMHVI